MLTLPNFLTLLRIVAIPVVLVLLSREDYAAAFLVFLAAGVTDTVDGAVARLTDSQSSLGAVLDPMADKLLLLSSFVLLGINGAIAPWLVVLVVIRDLIVVLGYFVIYFVHQEAMEVDPSRLGKVNTFFELFTIGFVLMALARPALPLDLVNTIMQSLTAATTAASGVQYVYRGLLWHQRRGSVPTDRGATRAE
jgi:cardiolipin synthase